MRRWLLFALLALGLLLPTSAKAATVTAVSYSSGTVTYTASNSFTAGETVNVTGIPLLNGIFNLAGIITSATSTQFTVAFNVTPFVVQSGSATLGNPSPGSPYSITVTVGAVQAGDLPMAVYACLPTGAPTCGESGAITDNLGTNTFATNGASSNSHTNAEIYTVSTALLASSASSYTLTVPMDNVTATTYLSLIIVRAAAGGGSYLGQANFSVSSVPGSSGNYTVADAGSLLVGIGSLLGSGISPTDTFFEWTNTTSTGLATYPTGATAGNVVSTNWTQSSFNANGVIVLHEIPGVASASGSGYSGNATASNLGQLPWWYAAYERAKTLEALR